MRIRNTILIAMIGSGLACAKESAPAAPTPQPSGAASLPAHAASQPVHAASQPVHAASQPGHAASQPGHAAPQPGQAGWQPGIAPAMGPSDAPVSGLVKLAEGVPADAVKPTDVLFIMARKIIPGAQPGQLVAVQRQANIVLPMRYQLSAKDLMMPGMPFAGPFDIQARLDRDGDPMTKGDTDLYFTAPGPVAGGSEGVHLMLGPKQ